MRGRLQNLVCGLPLLDHLCASLLRFGSQGHNRQIFLREQSLIFSRREMLFSRFHIGRPKTNFRRLKKKSEKQKKKKKKKNLPIFPFFPCLIFPDTSAKISRSEVWGPLLCHCWQYPYTGQLEVTVCLFCKTTKSTPFTFCKDATHIAQLHCAQYAYLKLIWWKQFPLISSHQEDVMYCENFHQGKSNWWKTFCEHIHYVISSQLHISYRQFNSCLTGVFKTLILGGYVTIVLSALLI